ncbi:MAG: protein-glutamate O-methyltransferase CheR [Desulfobacteraceae bacterium]|nr:MAG: protein-glutamate O-methyltransferase CheR [Desulfobacteraceae bacterium]
MKQLQMQLDLTERDYIDLSNLIYEKCGIYLHKGKRELLRARLAKVLRKHNFASVREYYAHLMGDQTGKELIQLLDSISTNLTFFFREPKHFDFLSNTAIPKLLRSKGSDSGKRLNLWCAGCSSGEEAYSIGMTLLEALPDTKLRLVSILATDISTRMLNAAIRGVYGEEKVEKISYDLRRRYFQKGVKNWEGFYRVKPALREAVEFKRLNLVEPFSFNTCFDIIFCRNVMIYFDKPTQEKLVNRFYGVLSKDGYFFIGHSESLTGIAHPFRYVQPSIYVK